MSRYIHPGSRLGVLLEVNCETDFVAASEKFQALVNELGMIIAATDCICVSAEDVPEEVGWAMAGNGCLHGDSGGYPRLLR